MTCWELESDPMSNRDRKACNKAIATAWKKERQLVLEGKGTRDWTEEQQLEIIELGKAFDDDGIAFEGQHMKSVEAYPEHQGNPDNIQLLSKAEHLAAHKGDFRNPTNWYYDPVSFEFNDFGDNNPIPCSEITLSEPIAIEKKSETIEKGMEDKKDSTNNATSDKPYTPEAEFTDNEYDLESEEPDGFVGWLKGKWEWVKKHPWKAVGGALGTAGAIYGGVKAGKAIKTHLNQQSNQVYNVVKNPVPRQTRVTRDLSRRVAKDIGEKIGESIQQPNVTSVLTNQAIDSSSKVIEGLSNYSVLLKKGYNTGVSQELRHKMLEEALAENGEQSIVRLLRFLISTRSGNKLGKYEKAIDVWKEDLDFILGKK